MDAASDLSGDAGGSVGREEIETAALISLAGMNPMHWYLSDDPLDQAFMIRVAERSHELRADLREDQSVRNANNVGKAFGG